MTARPFIHEDFLLETETARDLYHGFAERLPIIDYHTHLPPRQIAENHRFATLTELWLDGDHYKWRAMRTNGVAEKLLHRRRQRLGKVRSMGQDGARHGAQSALPLDAHGAARSLRHQRAARRQERACHLRSRHAAARGRRISRAGPAAAFRRGGRVHDRRSDRFAGTSRELRAAPRRGPRLYPTWRPDKALAVEDLDLYNDWLDRLEEVADVSISSLRDSARRAAQAARLLSTSTAAASSDHGLETIYAEPCTAEEARAIFDKARHERRSGPTKSSSASRRSLRVRRHGPRARLGAAVSPGGAAQQQHAHGADARSRHRVSIRSATFAIARPLARFLDRLDQHRPARAAPSSTTRTRPTTRCWPPCSAISRTGPAPGKMQYGSAWWFLDQKEGIEKQIGALSNMGLLARFVGMLTDSRSFLSYSRHEYFRRLLCNMLGDDVRRGLVPNDRALLGSLVENVCFYNAKHYFRFEMPDDEDRSAARRRLPATGCALSTLTIKAASECRWDAVSLGEVMLRLDPGDQRIHTTRSFRAWEGGGEYNVARGLRRCFGLRTAIVTALADNPVGRLIEDLMLQGGVDLSHVRWVPYDGVGRECATVSTSPSAASGRAARSAARIADTPPLRRCSPSDVDWEALFGSREGARWLHTGGVFCGLSETTPLVAREAMQHARRTARASRTISTTATRSGDRSAAGARARGQSRALARSSTSCSETRRISRRLSASSSRASTRASATFRRAELSHA